jgi:hypothetical protein
LNSPGITANCPSSANACGHQEALLQRNGSSGYRNGVVYVDDPAGGNQNNVNTVAQQSARLVRQRMTLSDAPFIQSDPNLTDFNQQGLWNYGLLPDFLQDVVNSSDSTGVAGNPPRQQVIQDMESLMLSAEQFIETWEKSQRACQALAQPIFAFQFTAGSLNCTPPPPTDGATCDILSYQ